MPFRPYDQNQSFLFPPHLNDWVTDDHPARIFSDLVDRLDIVGFKAAEVEGRPRYDTRMMLKVLLWAYANGVRASRKIEERLHSDVVFMWLAGLEKPDFRTICDFRRCNEAELNAIFARVVVMARLLGMARLGLVALDGTKVRASAGINSFKKVKEWRAALAEAKQKVAEILAEAETLDRADEAELGGRQSSVRLDDALATAKRRATKIEALLSRIPKDTDENMRVSSTDPDARFMHTSMGSMPAYNAELVVTPDQIVVSAHVTNEPVDQNQLLPGLERTERICGEKPGQVVADTGFSGGKNLQLLEELGIDGYIPESGERNIGKNLRARPELFSKAAFEYEAEHDRYQCPAGATMKPVAKQRKRSKYGEREGTLYRTVRGTCLKCPLKQQCTETKDPDGRSITRDGYEAERLRMRAKLNTKEGKAVYGRRKTIVEPTIGQIKVVGGFRQFLLRGERKAGLEWLWAVTAHCVLKIVRRVADGTVEPAWAT
jgi:transposase